RTGGGGLQHPQGGGADRDDPAPGGDGLGDEGGGLGPDLAPLGVHAVGGDVIDLDGQEGAGADVQRHPRHAHAARREVGEENLVEVQGGGGGGHGTGAGGED